MNKWMWKGADKEVDCVRMLSLMDAGGEQRDQGKKLAVTGRETRRAVHEMKATRAYEAKRSM